MSELELVQQINTRFITKLGKNGNKIRQMFVQVYTDNSMKKTVSIWVKCFPEESHNDYKKLWQD